MKKFRIVLTDYMYETLQPFYDVYDKEPDVEFVPMQLTSKKDIMRETEFADAVIVHFQQLDSDIIGNLKNCKIIARSAVGVDNIDLEAASRAKIPVANVPDYCIEEVSNHAILLLLACAKRLNILERTVKEGKWDYSVTKPVHAIRGRTLGLLGAGNIACCVAKKAQAFGMKVIASDPGLRQEQLEGRGITLVSQNEMLAQSDFVSIHAPLNRHTQRLVNADFLSRMKRGAILINTARGGLVDESALYDAIKNGQLGGAGLDVLTQESISLDDPLLTLENVILTPHAAWYTEEAMYTLLTSAAAEVIRGLHGQTPKHQVNRF